MNRLIYAAALIAAVAVVWRAQKQPAEPAASMQEHRSAVEAAPFIASTERTFDQLMDDATRVMHEGMHAPRTGEPDRDFVAMMIPHHQGAIDMAKALLLYGEDERLKRLALEIIADQQNEAQWMQLWLSRHSSGRANR